MYDIFVSVLDAKTCFLLGLTKALGALSPPKQRSHRGREESQAEPRAARDERFKVHGGGPVPF